jgi:hypothetical protein
VRRWVALLPGQKWITGAGETVEITGYVDDDTEGGLVFCVRSPDGRLTSTDLATPYEHMEKFLEQNEGALLT